MPESLRDELKALLEDGPQQIQEPTLFHRLSNQTFEQAFGTAVPLGPFDWPDLQGPIPGVKPENPWLQHIVKSIDEVEEAIAKPDPEQQ